MEINHKEREIRAKIIYYGPPAGGKTTNLLELSRRAHPRRRGQMLSVDTTQERTLLLDLVGVKAPAFRNYNMRFQVIAVPGQRMYAASRRFLLTGADAVVFVANSAADRWEETLESMKEMNEYLAAQGIDPKSIPVVFQYNKQDLPEVTPMEAMERTLNARKSDSFPAVAIRGEGVLETFAATLRRTLQDVLVRYKLADELQGGQSIEDWADKTMDMVFGPAAGEDEKGEKTAEAPKAKARKAAESAKPSFPEAAMLDASPEDLWRMAVRVKSSGNLQATPAGTANGGTAESAEHLVESYVEAAARLSESLEELKEKHEATEHRLEELGTSIDAAQALLSDAPAQEVLEGVIERIGKGLGSDVGSLSLVRPGGELSPVVLKNLEAEPLYGIEDGEGQPMPLSLMSGNEPVIFKRGDTGRLEAALDQLGESVTALVAIPVRTPVRTLGLVVFYLPQESAAPTPSFLPHLTRLGQGLGLAIEIASVDVAAERLQRMEKAALVGHVTEQALSEVGAPIDRLLTSVGNAIAQMPQGSGAPPKLLGELLSVSNELVKAQQVREAVLGFLSGKLPEARVASLEEVFGRIRDEVAEPLRRTGIELEVEKSPDADEAAADAFLLRCVLLGLVENFRNYLAGTKGGRIHLTAERAEAERVRIAVTDNADAVRSGSDRAVPDYLSWSLDRRARSYGLALAQKVVEHYKGEWQMTVNHGKGNEASLTLPVKLDKPPQ